MKKQIFLTAAMALTIFTACKDEDKKSVVEAPVAKTKTELLTAEAWYLKSAEIKSYLNDSLVFSDTEFLSGKALFLDNNTVISSLDGEPDDTSSWSLNGNTLIIDSMPMDILELNDNKLTLEFKEEEVIPDYGTMKLLSTTYFTR